MDFTVQQEHFISTYLDAIKNGNAAIFAGAGLSKDSGVVDWRELLAPAAKRLGLKIEKESDLVALAQFSVNARSNRTDINRLILDDVGRYTTPNEKHVTLARLPIDTYWTINYDKLIEDALKAQGKTFDVKSKQTQFAVSRSKRDAVVYKMHGDVDDPDSTVFIRDDYEEYHLKNAPFVEALIGDLLHKRFLFVGLSFQDPNLNFVLGRIRARFKGGGGGEHFCLMREEVEGDDSEEDFKLRLLRQKLVADDLLRFNIAVVFVKEYKDIDRLLAEIERRYRRTSVFISGSADDTSPWPRAETEAFLTQLANALVGAGCRIVTGFGRGVGPHVVSGALETTYRKSLAIDQTLVVRPFPHFDVDSSEAAELRERHRAELIGLAGVVIFVFGNRDDGGKLINAPGVRTEFELAKSAGLMPVPVGGTGHMSEEIHAEVMEHFKEFYPEKTEQLQVLFDKLGTPAEQLTTYIEPVLEIIGILRGEQ